MSPDLPLSLGWFAASVCIVVGLRRIATPRRARRGVRAIGLGLALAVATAFALPGIGPNLGLTLIAMALGCLILLPVRRAETADAGRLIALFNACGGAAAAALAALHLGRGSAADAAIDSGLPDLAANTVAVLALCLGGIAAGGSLIAWWRLSSGRDPTDGFARRQTLYLANAAVVLLLALVLASSDGASPALLALFLLSSVLFGVGMSLPITIADMPVLIALYNAVAGLAVALDGMLIDNPAMIVAGSLVFAAGSLLMRLTARAVNRRLGTIMYSGLGLAGDDDAVPVSAERMNRIDPAEAAIALGYAERILVIPGYGMALSRAHHKLRELTQVLEERGVDTRFAIHPVAGRLPGHMNVLLAEAGVPYERIVEATEANQDIDSVDVALVVGADDIVNPVARGRDGGELAGLAIIEADRARRVIVLRQSDAVGHAGLANPLMTSPRTRVMLGDALASIQSLIAEVKKLD